MTQGSRRERETPVRTCGDAGGVTKSGSMCRVYLNLSPINGLCLQHDPERVEARAALVAGAGRASGVSKRLARAGLPDGVPKAPQTLRDAEQFASWLARAVAIGVIDPKVAHVTAVALKEFTASASKRLLEDQVKALRKELAEAKKARAR